VTDSDGDCKSALGGGFDLTTSAADESTEVRATASFPLDSDAWRVCAEVVEGGVFAGTWTVAAWAPCATASP
jgi:hypothetical protein